MNNNLIITHKDGRTWNEGQLEDLLFDSFGIMIDGWKDAPPTLHYQSVGGWYVQHNFGITPPDEYGNIQTGAERKPLDPSLYTVSPVGMMAVESVKDLLREIKMTFAISDAEDNPDAYIRIFKGYSDTINTIASKYLGKEN